MILNSSYAIEKDNKIICAHLIFSVNSQIYAVKASNVIEIAPINQIAPLPHVAPYILGVTKVHDVIYSVMDLRIRFGAKHHTGSCPVVAILLAYKERKICMVVDKAISVLNIDTSKMDSPVGGSDYVLGSVQVKNRNIALLSTSKIFDIFE